MLRVLCSVLLVPFRLNHSLPAKRVTSMKQTSFLFAPLIFTGRAATDLPAGSAKGSLTYDGATAELKFAAAFVDQKDERKPIVSATGFDQLCATFRTAISSAGDNPN